MFPFFLCHLLFKGMLCASPASFAGLPVSWQTDLPSHAVFRACPHTWFLLERRSPQLSPGTETWSSQGMQRDTNSLPHRVRFAQGILPLLHHTSSSGLDCSSPALGGLSPPALSLLLTTSLPAGPAHPRCVRVLPLALYGRRTETSQAACPPWGPGAGSAWGLSAVGV